MLERVWVFLGGGMAIVFFEVVFFWFSWYNLGMEKITPPSAEQLKTLEIAFGYDATIAEACADADYSASDFNLWLVDNQDYRQKFEQIRNLATLKARKAVVDSFEDKPETALKYLERKLKGEFSTRTESKQEVQINISQIISSLSGKTAKPAVIEEEKSTPALPQPSPKPSK